MKIPFVYRKTHNRVKEDLETKIRAKDYTINTMEKDIRSLEQLVSNVLPRIIQINTHEDRMYKTYRVCVDFHRDMVERCFTHGVDEDIKYFAHILGKEIERKMIQFNFARCDDLDRNRLRRWE